MWCQLTAATTALITKLSSSVHSELALRQYVGVGMLLQFESLISCHGDEVGMLEDMDVAMHDLACVRYVVTSRTDGNATTAVSVSGSRLINYLYLFVIPFTGYYHCTTSLFRRPHTKITRAETPVHCLCHVLLLASPAVKSPAFNRHRVCEDTGPRLRDLPSGLLHRCPGWCDEGHYWQAAACAECCCTSYHWIEEVRPWSVTVAPLRPALARRFAASAVQTRSDNAPLSATQLTQGTSVPSRLLHIGRLSSRSSTSTFRQPSAVT